QKAHGMRHEQADITDGASKRNGESGEDRRAEIDDQTNVADIYAEGNGLLLAGQKKIQVGGGGINGPGSNEEPDGEKPDEVPGRRSGEIAHEPESHVAKIAAGKSGHEKHDHGRQERRRDDSGEEECCGVELSLPAAEKIDGNDGPQSTQ